MAWAGMDMSAEESQRVFSSAVRDAGYMIVMGTGLILMAVSPIIFACGRLIAWMEDHEK